MPEPLRSRRSHENSKIIKANESQKPLKKEMIQISNLITAPCQPDDSKKMF